MSETPKYVILKLREIEAKRLRSSHGAYPGSNIYSIGAQRFRMRMAEFLDFAFGDLKAEKKEGKDE